MVFYDLLTFSSLPRMPPLQEIEDQRRGRLWTARQVFVKDGWREGGREDLCKAPNTSWTRPVAFCEER